MDAEAWARLDTNMKNINFDIDIDFGDRDAALKYLPHIRASAWRNDAFAKHATGIYPMEIPHDAHGAATIDYRKAEERGYVKLDFLNVSVYERVRSEDHLIQLMSTEPPWERLLEKEFVERLIHIGNYHSTISALPEPIDSIPRMAMFLALIRPGKKHLIGKTWSEVAKTIWDKTEEYSFKKSHAVSYAHLVVVDMNLNVEEGH